MSSTLLEQARQALEYSEAYEKAIGEQLSSKPKTTKQQVWQQHHIANLMTCIKKQSGTALEVVKDGDGSFKEELETMKGANAFGSFYESLKQTREYYMRFPNIKPQQALSLEADMECTTVFSGEEVFGKYLDLHALHERSCNMKQFGPTEYLDYLAAFSDFSKVPSGAKMGAAYAEYLKDLLDYLESFFQRAQPLVDFASISSERSTAFQEAWEKGTVPGWSAGSAGTEAASTSNTAAKRPVDMSSMHSAQDLEALGLQRLKEGLEALGMKCGGSLSDRAERLFSVKGVAQKDIPKNLLAKAAKKRKRDAAETGGDNGRAVAEREFGVGFMVEQLLDVVEATKRHVEKRQTQLVEERAAELEEEEFGTMADQIAGEDGTGGLDDEEDEDEEDDGPLYNPLNLPLGWDGKPIPFWLYKLHGLGVEYKCEICGNQSYWGRRAFDRHFQEWRHAHGMRCLGIPNTKHFHDITLIEDAINLYEKLKDTIRIEQFDAAQEEEFEDSEGHVLNRKTYEDLARQGLL
uniref:Matrin-type domain-containing protein n=1 Tax=Rhizochromulina marina TaxID=1034831 RepID=A0A7S2W3N3_9STRA